MDSNVTEGVLYEQPKTIGERKIVAASCKRSLKLTMPVVVDEIDNRTDNAYAAWPERIFIVDAAGRIAYAGKQGPWGFKPEEAREWLVASTPKTE